MNENRRPSVLEPQDSNLKPRAGLALIALMVALAIATALVVSWLQIIVVERRALGDQKNRLQAEWLAESALDRAAARLRNDPKYSGETWGLAAEELDGFEAAEVAIRVEPAPDQPERRLVHVVADYPAAEEHRQRQSKDILIDLNPSRGAP